MSVISLFRRGQPHEEYAVPTIHNHLLTARADLHARRLVSRLVMARPGEFVCDLVAGKGETTVSLARRYRSSRILAVEGSPKKLRSVRKRVIRFWCCSNVRILQSNPESTAIASGCVDAVTVNFALGDSLDRKPLLSEVHRVLRPHGRLFVLEHSVPARRRPRMVYLIYIGHMIPFVGRLLTRVGDVGAAVRPPGRGLKPPAGLLADIRGAGFARVRIIAISYGIDVLYLAQRN